MVMIGGASQPSCQCRPGPFEPPHDTDHNWVQSRNTLWILCHILIYPLGQLHIVDPLPGMFMGSERKKEEQEESHKVKGKTCKQTVTQSPNQTQIYHIPFFYVEDYNIPTNKDL